MGGVAADIERPRCIR